MSKSKKRKLYNVNKNQEIKARAKLSEVLSGIAQLILQGTFPATHAQILVESIGVLETLAQVERQREAEKAALEPTPEEPKEETIEEKVNDENGAQ